MKKYLSLLLVMLAATAVFMGCNAKNKEQTESVQPEKEAESIVNTTEPSEAAVALPDETKEEPEEAESTGLNELKNDELVLLNEGPLSYLNFTVSIPKEWDGKVYAIAFDSGVSFVQKLSYDYEEGMGFLFSITTADNQVARFTGEHYIAYSKDKFYYYNTPTDVPWVYDDEAISEDYQMLAGDISSIVDSIKIDDDVRFDIEEFVCPMSEFKAIPEEMIWDISRNRMETALDEIYARHGADFSDDYYKNLYFESKSWYEPQAGVYADAVELGDVEKENVEFLKKAMDDYDAEHVYPKRLAENETLTETPGEGAEEIEVSFRCIDDSDIALSLNGNEYILSELCNGFENLYTEAVYITKINPYFDGFEIGVFEYGMDDNYGTSFFAIEDASTVKFAGRIPGCQFKDISGCIRNGFCEEARVEGVIRTYLLGTGSVFAGYWYDASEHEFSEPEKGYIYEMVPSKAKTVAKDIEITKEYDTGDKILLKKGQTVHFLGCNLEDCIEIGLEDGTRGYLKVTEDMTHNPEEYFSDIYG